MHSTLKIPACAGALACASEFGSLQVNAADDASDRVENQIVADNADSSHLGRLNLAEFTMAWTAYAKRGN